MAVNPEVTSIIAILIGFRGTAPPEGDGSAFGANIKGHILGSESELNFGQELANLLPAVQQPEPNLLGVHPDHGVF